MDEIRMEAINKLDNLIVEWTERGEMLGIDFSEQIKEMESLEGVEETPLDYEDFEQEEYERMNERDLKGGI